MANITLNYYSTENDPRRALEALLEEILNGQQDLTFEHQNDAGEKQWISLMDLNDDED